MSTVGNNIMNRRKALGMTQEELAKRMGYKSKSTINKIELGINDIPQSKISSFAEVLGTTPSQLMGWETEDKKIDPIADDDRLSGNKRQLIEFLKTVPEEKVDLLLKVMKSIVEDD